MATTTIAEGSLITPLQGDRYRVACSAHDRPAARLDRTVDSPGHAYNLEAKHLREYHANDERTTEQWPDLNLSAVATLVAMAATLEVNGGTDDAGATTAVLGMWEALTGLPRDEAVDLALRIQASHTPVVAAVVPF